MVEQGQGRLILGGVEEGFDIARKVDALEGLAAGRQRLRELVPAPPCDGQDGRRQTCGAALQVDPRQAFTCGRREDDAVRVQPREGTLPRRLRPLAGGEALAGDP